MLPLARDVRSGVLANICTTHSRLCRLATIAVFYVSHFAQPTEFNTCVFKLEVKNPSNPADVPDPMPKGTSYAAGPRRTMNVFRYE